MALLLLGVGFCALRFVRGYERRAQRALMRCYLGVAIHENQEPGNVVVSYETHHGLLAWSTQQTHCVVTNPGDARILLGRLFRFNMLWGSLCAGGLIFAPLALLNYVMQRRAITAQQRGDTVVALGLFSSPLVASPSRDDNPYAAAQSTDVVSTGKRGVSLIRHVIGWTSMGLCAMFTISVLAQLLLGRFESAVGSALVALLLGWAARDYLRRA